MPRSKRKEASATSEETVPPLRKLGERTKNVVRSAGLKRCNIEVPSEELGSDDTEDHQEEEEEEENDMVQDNTIFVRDHHDDDVMVSIYNNNIYMLTIPLTTCLDWYISCLYVATCKWV